MTGINTETTREQLLSLFAADIISQQVINRNEIYLQVNTAQAAAICSYISQQLGYVLVTMWANDERNISGQYALYYGFSDREHGDLLIIKTMIEPNQAVFASIAETVPAAVGYEREIHDLFGLIPIDNPDLRRLVFHNNWPEGHFPLRKDYPCDYKPPLTQTEITFKKVLGDGVFEVPVGPVHAGIIEPGHFRFSVAGEPIINLEAQLFYTHKGIEKLSEGVSIEKGFYIAERISGDETFTNSLAYCQAIEKIAGISIPERAQYTRVILAELERLICHLGDLTGICVDVAYGFAANQFNMMKGWAYGLADQLCGSRFLRGANHLGGVRKDFISGQEQQIIDGMTRIYRELTDTVDIIKAKTMFIDRVENKGIVKNQIARDLNAVGPAGRSAGVTHDVRKDFPYAAYSKLVFSIPEHNNGDVNCRMNVKLEECFAAIDLITQAVEAMPAGKVLEPISQVEPYRFAFGLTEAPRGENLHWLMTGENNTIFRYKIRTPSFCNWPVLCHAVQGNIIPDFPLINKSFNLSYAGNDL